MKEDMRRTSRARRAQQRKRRNRRIALTLCVMFVVLAASIGGTVAWLTAKTDTITNTFTYGDIKIKLDETKPVARKATIVPGVDIKKDPEVTVEANSEDCWLFVTIDEVNWPDFKETDGTTAKVSYEIAAGWTKLEGVAGNVYYRKVAAKDADQTFAVLKGDVVKVSQNLTKSEVNSIAAGTKPELTFKAYAVQQANVSNDAVQAWTLAQTAA